ncbi:MAG: gamma-glutamyl-gamma-aminobutyrate hydrolase family protein [Chloroflexi bacterium]|nr:gamma-glutamyl-gamma-aminobutyrate hydrolase family protein [Chloroflexota bacterium]
MRPWIAIPCDTVVREGRPTVLGAHEPYVRSVQRAGGRVLLVPPGDLEAARELFGYASGLLLTGGPDVDPARYGEPNTKSLGVDAERDDVDFELLKAAREARKPVFGICRGQQVINVALGGSLYQDVPAEQPSEVTHRTPSALGRTHLAHVIEVQPGSRLAAITGQKTLEVNSFHHQAVKGVAASLKVTAISPDGLVEALESDDGHIVAVQCHPEELTASAPWAAALFQDLVRRAAG